MKYLLSVVAVIAIAVIANFLIKDNDAYLLITIATIIGGFWYGVLSIAEEDSKA